MNFYGLLHNNKKLMIETTNIILTKNTFIDGNFGVKILFDKKQSVLEKLYNHFKIMDDYFGSDNFQKNLSSSKKLSYEPIVKKKLMNKMKMKMNMLMKLEWKDIILSANLKL
nr:hypothetical protein [Mimivirus sp.]